MRLVAAGPGGGGGRSWSRDVETNPAPLLRPSSINPMDLYVCINLLFSTTLPDGSWQALRTARSRAIRPACKKNSHQGLWVGRSDGPTWWNDFIAFAIDASGARSTVRRDAATLVTLALGRPFDATLARPSARGPRPSAGRSLRR